MTKCDVSFVVPQSWTIDPPEKQVPEDDECTVGLSPPGWAQNRGESDEEINSSAIFISVSNVGLDQDACDSFLVCRDERGWFNHGRAGARNYLRVKRVGNRTILSGYIETGAYRKGGGYIGMAEALYSAVSTNGRLIIVVGGRPFEDEVLFQAFVDSIQATRAPPN